MTDYSKMNRDQLRAECKNRNIHYSKLNAAGMRKVLVDDDKYMEYTLAIERERTGREPYDAKSIETNQCVEDDGIATTSGDHETVANGKPVNEDDGLLSSANLSIANISRERVSMEPVHPGSPISVPILDPDYDKFSKFLDPIAILNFGGSSYAYATSLRDGKVRNRVVPPTIDDARYLLWLHMQAHVHYADIGECRVPTIRDIREQARSGIFGATINEMTASVEYARWQRWIGAL